MSTLNAGIALAGQVPQIPGPLDQYKEGLSVQTLLNQSALQKQQQQANQVGLQQQQLQLKQEQLDAADRDKFNQAFHEAHGDWDAAIKAATENGTSGQFITKAQMARATQVKTLAESNSAQLVNEEKKHDALAISAAKVLDAAPEDRPAIYAQERNDHILTGAYKANEIPDTMPSEQQLRETANSAKAVRDMYAAAQKLKNDQAEATEKAAKLPGEQAESIIKTQEAAMTPEQRAGLKPPTEAVLALKAAQGDPTAEAALKRLDKSKRESRPINILNSPTDAKDIADAIESGDQPPTLTGLYRNAGPVRAELARRGVPIAKMEIDWKATQKYVNTLNGTQQTRLRQDISTTSDTLDKVEGLYNEWKSLAPQTGYKVLNKGTLLAMKNLPGRPGAVATALEAQIADTTAGLGTIYMGGNSPTDHSLGLAAKALSADWNDDTFKEALKQARSNIKIRQNSMLHSAPAGTSGDNGYAPSQQPNTPSAPAPEKHPFFSQFGGTVRP